MAMARGRAWRRPQWWVLLVVTVTLAAFGAPAPASASSPGPSGFIPPPSSGIGTRIVGGTAVPDGKYPFQAALLAQPFGATDRERQFCGGSLISPVHVLTAAHCVDLIGAGPEDLIRLSELRVVVGRTVLTSTQGHKRFAARVDIHPRWNPDTARFDVAVITLARAVTGIRPVQLVTPGTDALERPGRLTIATGWGNTTAQPVGPGPGGFSFPDRLREVTLPLVSAAECSTAYTIGGVAFMHPGTMICAGRTGKDTCQGDSGGPLFVKATTGGHIQIGITSWGAGCAATGFPGVYTRLSNRSIGNFVLVAAGGLPV